MKLNVQQYFAATCVISHRVLDVVVHICADDTHVKAIVIDTSKQNPLRDIVTSLPKKGSNQKIDEVVFFLEMYQHKKFINPPACDVSIYTENERKVLNQILYVPVGSVITYADLAIQCGFASGARFVGSVMAKNVFPILYPCHRVILSNGDIGHYTAGKRVKQLLLLHEGYSANKI